jgi:CcmD family protein
MGHWGFVFLAYGIVWGVMLFYLFCLKRRFRRAETQLSSMEGPKSHAQK